MEKTYECQLAQLRSTTTTGQLLVPLQICCRFHSLGKQICHARVTDFGLNMTARSPYRRCLSREHTDYIDLASALIVIRNPSLTRNSEVQYLTLRASSYGLAIERDRYVHPKLNNGQRLCLSSNVVQDEKHFITACRTTRWSESLLTNCLKETHHLLT